MMRVKYDTSARREVAQNFDEAQARSSSFGSRMEVVPVKKGEAFVVVEIDTITGVVTAASPIDPERILLIAAEAVEFYNEAKGIWERLVGLWTRFKGWFKDKFKGGTQ